MCRCTTAARGRRFASRDFWRVLQRCWYERFWELLIQVAMRQPFVSYSGPCLADTHGFGRAALRPMTQTRCSTSSAKPKEEFRRVQKKVRGWYRGEIHDRESHDRFGCFVFDDSRCRCYQAENLGDEWRDYVPLRY